MPRPTVVVTRPAGQSRQLTEALQAAGLDVLGFPLLAIGPAADDTPLRAALGRLADYALVVFVSPNAVSFALDALAQVQNTAGAAQWPAGVPVAVVGPSSVVALAERGIAAPTHRVIAPAGAQTDTETPGETPRFDSEALWSELDTAPAAFAGRSVLIIRGNGGRDWLGDRLREAGATVDAVEAYSRTLPEPTTMQWQAVRDSLKAGAPPYAWLLTSSEAVRNLDALARLHLSPQEHERLKQMQCIAPHARIAAQAQALGFAHVLPAAPGDTGLLAACTQWGNAHAGPAAPIAAPIAVPVAAPALKTVPEAPIPANAEPASAPAAMESTGSSGSTTTKVERVTPDTTSPSSSSAASPGAGGTNFTMHAPAMQPDNRRNMAVWWLVAVIVLLAIAGGFFWLQMRVEHLTQELARRQQSNDALVQETRVLSKNAQDTVKELQSKVGALDGQVVEARDKQAALEQVYQDLMRNRDDWEIAEIQQLLTNAGQQLQLTGNVQVALAALQSADARLARADKPQYNQLRRALARDIARMKAVPDTDLTGAAIKLDESINQIDALPLLSGERMLDRAPGEADKPAQPGAKGAAASAAAAPTGNVVTRVWDYVLGELGQVIRVRKVEDTNALLLSGDQGWFLRENVKLRLLNARLALLSRNEPVFRNDLAAAQAMIGRYFDTRSRRVQGVLTLLKQAQASAVSVSLPTMAESLGALRALKKE